MIKPLQFPSPDEAAAQEAEYRRGFADGYSQAIDDMRAAMERGGYVRPREGWNIVANFYDTNLAAWRRGDGDLPPTFVPGPTWRQLRQAVLERDGHRCVWCGSPDDLECDHIRPVARGGLPELNNLRTLCRTCHRSRT